MISACPYGICSKFASSHVWCAKVFAGKLNDFTNEQYPPIDTDRALEELKKNFRYTMMDDGSRIYLWRATRKDSNHWLIEVGY